MEVLPNSMVVIIWQYINVSSQHVVYFKCTRCYVNYISIKKNLRDNGDLEWIVIIELMDCLIFNKIQVLYSCIFPYKKCLCNEVCISGKFLEIIIQELFSLSWLYSMFCLHVVILPDWQFIWQLDKASVMVCCWHWTNKTGWTRCRCYLFKHLGSVFHSITVNLLINQIIFSTEKFKRKLQYV